MNVPRCFRIGTVIAAILLLCATSIRAQVKDPNPNIRFEVLTPTVTSSPGGTALVKVRAVIASNSHLYTTKPYKNDFSPQPLEVSLEGDTVQLKLTGEVKSNKAPVKHYDEGYELEVEYWSGTVEFTLPVQIAPNAASGTVQSSLRFYFMTCDDKTCMPPCAKLAPFTVNIR